MADDNLSIKSPFKGLRTTIYQVPDLVKAKAWYSKVFEATPYFDEPFYVGYSIGGYELGLQPLESMKNNNLATGGVYTYWGVDDVQDSYERMLTAGAIEHNKPQEVGGGIWVATVLDPWQNIIGIIYNPHFNLSENKNEG